MGSKNRLVVMMFFLVNASILAIVGLVVSSVIDPGSTLLPTLVKQDLNWFSMNVSLSQNIVIALYVISAILALLAVYNIIATAFDSNSSDKDFR